jgi:hypothetical protein
MHLRRDPALGVDLAGECSEQGGHVAGHVDVENGAANRHDAAVK